MRASSRVGNERRRSRSFSETRTSPENSDSTAVHTSDQLEQTYAALGRVATLVARGGEPERIFSSVVNEVGPLLGSKFAGVRRYEPEHRAESSTWRSRRRLRAVLLGAAIAYAILTRALVALHGPGSPLARAVGRDRKGKLSIVAYVVAIAVAPVLPWLPVGVYVAVAAAWLIPDLRVECVISPNATSAE